MQQFPFVFFTWNLRDPAYELKDEYEFKRYVNELKLQISDSNIEVMDDIGQINKVVDQICMK